ncbi:MAG: diacylglycerol kinase family protein [Candidatus Berkelbacteria bacterium]|nr:diacylglycerol kinase family protein [Candidatus Berkelbacteria bacterium]
MYYYIFDVRKCKNRRQIEAIKDHISSLGISGEFVIPDKIKPARDLAEQGIYKGFTTIVAIGSDDLINEVATAMLAKQQAFGIIPLGASENIAKIIGATSWEEAATSLRYRRIVDTRVGILNEAQVFFSYCEIEFDKPTSVTVEFEHLMIQAKARELYVANRFPQLKKIDEGKLDLIMKSVDPASTTIWGRLRQAVGGGAITRDLDVTLMRSDGIRIFSPRQLPILVDGRVMAKTPATFGVSQKTIRLITKKS